MDTGTGQGRKGKKQTNTKRQPRKPRTATPESGRGEEEDLHRARQRECTFSWTVQGITRRGLYTGESIVEHFSPTPVPTANFYYASHGSTASASQEPSPTQTPVPLHLEEQPVLSPQDPSTFPLDPRLATLECQVHVLHYEVFQMCLHWFQQTKNLGFGVFISQTETHFLNRCMAFYEASDDIEGLISMYHEISGGSPETTAPLHSVSPAPVLWEGSMLDKESSVFMCLGLLKSMLEIQALMMTIRTEMRSAIEMTPLFVNNDEGVEMTVRPDLNPACVASTNKFILCLTLEFGFLLLRFHQEAVQYSKHSFNAQ